jgi:hypothetical protein
VESSKRHFISLEVLESLDTVNSGNKIPDSQYCLLELIPKTISANNGDNAHILGLYSTAVAGVHDGCGAHFQPHAAILPGQLRTIVTLVQGLHKVMMACQQDKFATNRFFFLLCSKVPA